MGGEVSSRVGGEITVEFFTRLDGMLDHIELVRGNETIQYFSGRGNQVKEFKGEYSEKCAEGTIPYYLRVFQTDGGAAWSSPVWVNGE